ncbi:hypothetical protein FJT64_022404 [Amphibalanus amphitrite]|uniref:Uncharacterized protein n=1 Tax=Amphibalanus amphitrite TaxID=1232801 RepID=A0A6A4WVD4_AMPAM|nr:hypothetical protein FJT64_022404 [Amphibalanus amphitrite]
MYEAEFKDTSDDSEALSVNDQEWLVEVKATIRKDDEGHYEVALPRNQLEEAERRIEDLDAYNRRISLLITGVPETNGEATDSLVLDVGRAAGLNLSADSLDRSLGRPQPGKVRPIIAKFATTNARQKLFDKRKELTAEKVGGHPVLTRSTSNPNMAGPLDADSEVGHILGRALDRTASLRTGAESPGLARVNT